MIVPHMNMASINIAHRTLHPHQSSESLCSPVPSICDATKTKNAAFICCSAPGKHSFQYTGGRVFVFVCVCVFEVIILGVGSNGRLQGNHQFGGPNPYFDTAKFPKVRLFPQHRQSLATEACSSFKAAICFCKDFMSSSASN